MRYSPIVLREKNITDFAKERNELLKMAENDWVFFVDSDEEVTDELEDELKKLKPEKFKAFYIKRKNYFLGRYVGTDKIIRLIKKGFGRWERAVHELYHLVGGTKAGYLKNCLIHNTAENLHDYIDKINNYSTLHALANNKEGKKATILKIVFYPFIKFMQTLFKSKHGVFSLMQAFHSFLAWSKLWILQKRINYKK